MTPAINAAGLESPVAAAKPKGLVPRSAIWLVVLALLGGLIMYAIYDISKETNRRKVEAGKAPNTALGAEPPQDALKKLMADQAARAASEPVLQVGAAQQGQPGDAGRIGLAVGRSSQPPVPAEVIGRASYGAPSSQIAIPAGAADGRAADGSAKAIAAQAELQARINASNLVAIDGRSSRQGRADAPQEGNAGEPQAQAQAQAQAMAEAQAAMGQVPNVDAIMKALGSPRGGAVVAQGPATRDLSWVKDVADAKPAPVTYATPAPSRNLLLQGTRIPAVTLEAVNSDMPGQITARATQDLRDSLTQQMVLVPAGTRFVGSYNAEVSPGQSRVLMAFSRMVLPDGRSVDLHASQATDAIGQSGITGDVDNHFLKMYAYSLAVAVAGERLGNKGVTAGVSLTGQSTGTKTIAGEVLADVSRRILDRNSNIPPTITTPVGERIYITLTRDLVLAPWKGQTE